MFPKLPFGLVLVALAMMHAAAARLPTPIIDKQVYAGIAHVWVKSIDAESTITIQRRTGAGEEELGRAEVQRPILNGGVTVALTGQPLKEGEMILAVAIKGSERSTSEEISVLPIPSSLLPPTTYDSILYAGSICVPTWGMLPYATASSWSHGALLGEGITDHEGRCDIRTRPLTTADVLTLETAVHNAPPSAAGNILPTHPIGDNRELPPVTIRGPLFECQQLVRVEDLIPGAQFEITASGATVFGPHYCAHSTMSTALLGRGLKESETITAKQSFKALMLESRPSRPVQVGPLRREELPTPFIFEPIREGESSVFLRALEGAKLEIEIVGDGFQERLTPEASDEINLGFNVRVGQKVRVRQQFAQGGPQCEVWSDWREADVQPSPRSVPPPEISAPLYPCAKSVAIKSKMEGALVTVWALTPPNEPIRVIAPLGDDKEAAIHVAPLAPNQRVGATQTAGGIESKLSRPVIVEHVPRDLPTPKISDPTIRDNPWVRSCNPSIIVENVLPGAHVDVFWNKLLIGAKEATDTQVEIPLISRLEPGAEIHASQSVCTVSSRPSNVLTALEELSYAGGHGSYEPVQGGPVLFDVSSGPTTGEIWMDTQCPVTTNTKVTIKTLTNTFEVLGSNEALITDGQSRARFELRALKPGYGKFEIGSDRPHFVSLKPDPSAMGLIEFSPTEKTLGAGESFRLRVSAKPVPDDRKLTLEADDSSIVSVPKEVIIPAGQSFGEADIKALQVGETRIHDDSGHYFSDGVKIDVTQIGPNILNFTSRVVDYKKARLEWDVECAPKCYVEIAHLHYWGDVHKNLPLKDTLDVDRDRNFDGTYRLTARLGQSEKTKEVTVPQYVGSNEQLQWFYFKFTNPSSQVRPCYVDAFLASNPTNAEQLAKASATNYNVKQISEAEYYKGC